MACEIENPFGYDRNSLPLDSFCQGISDDTKEILNRADSEERAQIFDRERVASLARKNLRKLETMGKDTRSKEKMCRRHSSGEILKQGQSGY